jgi:glutathione S-transferase
MKLTYYYSPGSVALAPHIALLMSGVYFTSIAVDFSLAQQKSIEYLAINPLGRVPALIVEEKGKNPVVITEASALLRYILTLDLADDCLLKDSANLPALMQARVDAFNSYLSSTVHVTHAHMRRAERWVDSEQAMQEMARKVPANLIDQFALIENHWFVGPWLHGDIFTVSDIYLFVMTHWLAGDGVEAAQFEKVYQHYQKMMALKQVSELLSGLHQ